MYSVETKDRFGAVVSRTEHPEKVDAAAAFRKATVAVRGNGPELDGEVAIYNDDRREVVTFWSGTDSRNPGAARALWAAVEPLPAQAGKGCLLVEL